MSQNPENLDEIDLYRDPDSGKLVGRDPDTGDTFPIPIESTKQDEIQIDEKATMSKDDGTVGDLAQYNQFGNIELGDSSGVNNGIEFFVAGLQAGYFANTGDLKMRNHGIDSLSDLKLNSSNDQDNDRVLFAGQSGLFVARSIGTDATIFEVQAPGINNTADKEATLALVQGTGDDSYILDVYNNTGYSSGGSRDDQFGISVKSRANVGPKPFIIDFDDNGSYVPRFKLNPSGSTEIKNGDVELDQGDGLILKSPDGTNHRVKVQDDGTLTTETI